MREHHRPGTPEAHVLVDAAGLKELRDASGPADVVYDLDGRLGPPLDAVPIYLIVCPCDNERVDLAGEATRQAARKAAADPSFMSMLRGKLADLDRRIGRRRDT